MCEVLIDFPNVIVISDDVYEHMLFDDTKLHKMANFENMF